MNISKLTPISLLNLHSGLSQPFDPVSLLDPTSITDSTSADSNSFLTPSLLDGGAGGDNALQLIPLEISSAAQILASKKNSLSKLATGVLDMGNLIAAAQGGLSQGISLLNSLKDLITQAQDPSLSSEKRQEINQSIKSTLDDYSELVNTTQYSNRDLFLEDTTLFVPTSETVAEAGVQVKLSNLSPDRLGLNQVDISTPTAAKQSLNIVNRAIQAIQKNAAKLQNSYAHLVNTATSFQAALQDIVKFQGNLTDHAATSLAQNIQPIDLAQAQDPSLLANTNMLF